MTPGNKGKQSAVYPAVAGISVQAVAASGPADAGAWTVPPGGLRFHQLALPNEGRARRRGGFEDGDREGNESAGAGSDAAGF